MSKREPMFCNNGAKPWRNHFQSCVGGYFRIWHGLMAWVSRDKSQQPAWRRCSP